MGFITNAARKGAKKFLKKVDDIRVEAEKLEKRLNNDVPGQMSELDEIIDTFEVKTKADKEYVKKIREDYEKEVKSIFEAKYDADERHKKALEGLSEYREQIESKFAKVLKSEDKNLINDFTKALGIILHKAGDKVTGQTQSS